MITTDFKATELCQHWCVQLRGQHQNYKHRYLSQVFPLVLDRDMIVFGDVNIGLLLLLSAWCCFRRCYSSLSFLPSRPTSVLDKQHILWILLFIFYLLSFFLFQVRAPWFCPWQTAPTLTLAARRFATYWSRQNQVNMYQYGDIACDNCF